MNHSNTNPSSNVPNYQMNIINNASRNPTNYNISASQQSMSNQYQSYPVQSYRTGEIRSNVNYSLNNDFQQRFSARPISFVENQSQVLTFLLKNIDLIFD